MNAISLVLIGGIGGGCAGIPLLFWQWQKSNLNKTNFQTQNPSERKVTEIREQSSSSPAIVPPKSKEGNCEVIKSLDKLETMLWNLGIDRDAYITISCKDTTKTKEIGTKIPNSWTGLFPEKSFVRNTSSEIGKFEIRMEITPLETGTADYKLVFSGDKFYSSLTGEWKGEKKEVDEKTVTIVSIVTPAASPNKIYLVPN